MEFAYIEGNLDIIKYLHENGCSLNTQTSIIAAEEQNVDVLQYLINNGYDYSVIIDKIENEPWFQEYQYMKFGIVKEHTLHLHHKIKRIQHTWLRYAYSPYTKIGHQRILRNFQENNALLN